MSHSTEEQLVISLIVTRGRASPAKACSTPPQPTNIGVSGGNKQLFPSSEFPRVLQPGGRAGKGLEKRGRRGGFPFSKKMPPAYQLCFSLPALGLTMGNARPGVNHRVLSGHSHPKDMHKSLSWQNAVLVTNQKPARGVDWSRQGGMY